MASVKAKSQSGGSKKSARELAKAQAAAAQKRGRLTQIIVIAAVALVVIGIIGSAVIISVVTQNDRRPSANTTITVAGRELPLIVDGTAIRIGPADAKVTIDMYYDYSCPHCKEYDAATAKTYEQLLGEGNLAINFRPIQFQSQYGQTAGNASAAVVAYQPADWLAFHSALFVNHTEQTDIWQNADFKAFAEQNGVTNPEALKAIEDGKYSSWITGNTGEAVKAGVQGTPTVIINGEKSELLVGQQLIDKVHQLAGA
ncbi:DsbA family protein [Microlunatus parietis]|uniref:Protein-disulfide isomerase n=1 Tax=Microlunatus parietis TaxID=682979 RepID=A0A7Y9IE34_9ACTN|nr:thioredoxin domain-containing protein [Microlunatus parietis]NYE75052.1 protein-disulfide isomerase [Microlunatus parietis]